MLVATYAAVRRSIVAFASKATVATGKKAPPFPTIIGTGFVIDERGIAATNRHVVRELEKLPSHPKTGEHAAFALACSEIVVERDGVGMDVVYVQILRWDKLTTFSGKGDVDYFGEPLPDVAFVQLKATGIPSIQLEETEGSWDVGTEIGTAGYPLGKEALTMYGKISQVAPILRHGVIASVYPFPCPRPHGFTIDVMTLGGESGSPVFRSADAKVLGLLHAGFENTNITMVVPSWLVAQAFQSYLQNVPIDLTGVPTFDELHLKDKSATLSWKTIE